MEPSRWENTLIARKEGKSLLMLWKGKKGLLKLFEGLLFQRRRK